MEEEVNIVDSISDFYSDPDTKIAILSFGVLFLLVFSKILLSLSVFNTISHDEATSWEDYQVSFNEQSVFFDDELILSDGQTEIINFEIFESQIPEGHLIGEINIIISYDETNSAIVGEDPCDTVQGSILYSDINLQWNDDNNTMSGGSNSCEEIPLKIRAYPDYDGEGYEIRSYNAATASVPWTENGYGLGLLDIQIDLEVQKSQVPTEDDDENESIQILVEIVCFELQVEEIV
tara:strand:- start:7381 stop:8085 length:705 start_codon:yes stop_codon:yes gene_type:complete